MTNTQVLPATSSRLTTALIAAVAAVFIATVQSATAAETVRIETRPFYGATITLEEGVRVFRPLPADRRVIINPKGATPLNLNFDESRTVSAERDPQNDDGDNHSSD